MIDASTDTVYRMAGDLVEIQHEGWKTGQYNVQALRDIIANLMHHRLYFRKDPKYDLAIEIYQTALDYLEARS
jgi:ribosomal protein S7